MASLSLVSYEKRTSYSVNIQICNVLTELTPPYWWLGDGGDFEAPHTRGINQAHKVVTANLNKTMMETSAALEFIIATCHTYQGQDHNLLSFLQLPSFPFSRKMNTCVDLSQVP